MKYSEAKDLIDNGEINEHEVKCLTAYFFAMDNGKNFEVRRDDRGYQRGDMLTLLEFKPQKYKSLPDEMVFSGNRESRRISYILTGGQFGIEPGYVILALEEYEDD